MTWSVRSRCGKQGRCTDQSLARSLQWIIVDSKVYDMTRFKEFIEERQRETGGWRGDISDGVSEPDQGGVPPYPAGDLGPDTRPPVTDPYPGRQGQPRPGSPIDPYSPGGGSAL